jgi:translation initiation factor 4E
MDNLTLESKLSRNWCLWYHQDKDNWKISGFKNVYTIKNTTDFWQLYNNWDKIGSINQRHYFLMEEGITPIWEDDNNKKGGCWSYKIHENQSQELWDDLSTYLVTENLSSKQNDITGLSICLKKNNYSVVKIWNRNSKDNSLALLNETILKKWGMDIIYIAHIPE